MPLLYEINTRAWLRELSERAGKPVRLADVPDTEFDRWDTLGFSDIWLMGVWEIGPGAREKALEQWRAEWRQQIPSEESDVHGSPFAIDDYVFDSTLGTPGDFLAFKKKLNQRGIGLILDIVPNHFSLDCDAAARYPSYFVQGRPGTPGTFTRKTRFGKKTFAHGKDPHFPPWTDTVQVDHRNRNAQETLTRIMGIHSTFADGFRCDMAMLVLPEVFERTWADFPPAVNEPARPDFWRVTWENVRLRNPYFLSLAEVYWDLEERLQEEGFNFTYHKPVYDLLLRGDFPQLQELLLKRPPEFLARCAHFLENHDEPRIASLLSGPRHKAAAFLLLLTLPGMAMLHDGQLEGRQAFAPIQLSKRLPEDTDPEIERFYTELLHARRQSFVMEGAGRVLQPREVPASGESWRSVIATAWTTPNGGLDLALLNLGEHPARFMLDLEPVSNPTPRTLFATHPEESFGLQVRERETVVDLPGQSARLVRFTDGS